MASRFDRDSKASGPVVQGFVGGGFSVNGGVYEALLLTPKRADGWEPPPLAELTVDHLAALLALDPQPEFLLLGTGQVMAFPPRSLVAALDARGIGIEAMDSRAAARTWGMLRGEDRWIAAALMPLSQA
ncbi:MAG TPA: MTH938/NDUFAF3 family protein [Allosphingosinicella sp.]|nr:MTH938/NDUFAF3 family protein [Allosphingosinicella sp.]